MAKDHCGPCSEHSGIQARQENYEQRLTVVEQAVVEIRDRLLGRPSWTVCVMITILTSAVVGMGIALLTMKG